MFAKHNVKYGVCLWWPDQPPCWVHPDDLEIAGRLVPGNRVFRREECENFADRTLGYQVFRFGDVKFRALPAIWMEVHSEGFELDDVVEIKSRLGKRRAGIARIAEITWNRNARVIEYFLMVNGQRIEQPYSAEDLQPAVRLGGHLGFRELRLSARTRIS